MNYAIILSGGIGTRMKTEGLPKQYLEVEGKPILIYTLEVFQKSTVVDKIVVVAAEQWREQIVQWMDQYGITKDMTFAQPGDSRQESILSGLEACVVDSQADTDRVIIHDAVRPLVTEDLIERCLEALDEHDGCLPVIPVKDTVYQSADGKAISNLLDRSTIFAGQTPESFDLHWYTKINRNATKEELTTSTGSSSLAYINGMDVGLIPGDDNNFKITTPIDLKRFYTVIGNKK